MRVETIPGVGGLYQLRVWEDGQPEPGTWDVEGQETLADPQFGSMLLISHKYDVTYGDVTVTHVPGAANVPPTAVDDLVYAPPGGSVDADLLANDIDTDGIIMPQSVAITQQPSSGTAAVHHTTGILTYTHDGSASTSDELRYTVLDNDGALSNEGVVSIVVTDDPPAPFASDDFNCGFDATWTYVDPLLDCSASLADAGSGDAWLELTLPVGTPHDAWGAGGLNEAVRLMQAAENLDFVMVVEWKAESTDGYNDQGILVESDASNWLRFDVFHDGSNLKAFAGKTVAGSNTALINTSISAGTATHARLTRAGNDYTFELSGDGSSWSTVGSWAVPMIVHSVGVYAGNPVDALAFTSQVDYVFEESAPISPEDGNDCTEVTLYCFGEADDCPCGNAGSATEGCANSTGRGSRLRPSGSTSVAADDLVLTAANLPAKQFGLFLVGGSPLAIPFGDGRRCVAPGLSGLHRLNPPALSGPDGFLIHGPGIVAETASFPGLGAIQAGGTYYFQAWYRDPTGPCGSGFNLSSAMGVTFTP